MVNAVPNRFASCAAATAIHLSLLVVGCHKSHGGPADAGIPGADMASCIGGGCGNCTDDSMCLDDRYCSCVLSDADGGACTMGICLNWADSSSAFDPTCRRPALFSLDDLSVATRCRWTDQMSSPVLMAPLVLDLDGDGKAEIVFATSSTKNDSHLIAIHSNDCSVMWDHEYIHQGAEPIAAADLDGDGHPEIVLLTGRPSVLTVLDYKGQVLAADDFPMHEESGAVIADVDGMPPAEIAIEGSVMRYHKGQLKLERLFANPVNQPDTSGPTSILVDLDGDGIDELVSSTSIFNGLTGANKTPIALLPYNEPGAWPAVADFNGDGKPDLVFVQEQAVGYTLTIFDYLHGRFLFGPLFRRLGPDRLPDGDGGPPSIADLDGDGVPEIVIAGGDSLCAFSIKCAGANPAHECKGGPGALWCNKTQDYSSGVSGATIFDLNGDGIPEVIYRDECWLRIYEGPTGRTLYAQAMTSGTGEEYPVIADVDGDGHADLIVTSDDKNPPGWCDGKPEAVTGAPWTGTTTGVFVLRDPMNRWPPTRSLWTSHPYHITDINDDLTVPAHETPSWTSSNSYRRNAGLQGALLPDLTAQQTPQDDNDVECSASFRLRAAICNRGAAPTTGPVAGSFYAVDPRLGSAMPLCSALTAQPLKPGECEPIACNWVKPPAGPHDLWLRVNDDGTHPAIIDECRTANDLALLPALECRPPPN